MVISVRSIHRGPEWVSKTNIRDYAVCPYGFWLLDTGKVNRQDVFSEIDDRLIAEGVAHEERILNSMPALPRALTTEQVRELARYVFGGPIIENMERRLVGRPDGIDIDAQAPIEIKSHIGLRPMDRYELAFYWLLLESQRTNTDVAPYGWFRGIGRDMVRVEIRQRDFDYVDYLVNAVREARTHGVEPRVCDCLICSTRPEVRKLFKRRRDVRLVWGVGPAHAQKLYRAGISTIHDLAEADPNELAACMRTVYPSGISSNMVVEWQYHARAMRDKKPVRFSEERFDQEHFIALDLEYDSLAGLGNVWLIGAHVQRNGKSTIFQAWCDRDAALRRGLGHLHDLLREHPDLPIITWNGDGADLPHLSAAAKMHRIPVMRSVKKRHVDLFGIVRRSLRLPIPRLDLKSVTEYLGVQRKSGISDGLEALMLFNRYCNSRSKERRARLRKKLLAYNREDLDALPVVVDFIRRA